MTPAPRKGFVDLQVNGWLGIDFSSPTLTGDEVHRATEALLRAGTVAYCATLITAEIEIYRRNLPIIARAMDEPGVRGHLLGIHLEGPYLSPVEGARGAHSAAKMRRPDRDVDIRESQVLRSRWTEMIGAARAMAASCPSRTSSPPMSVRDPCPMK